MEDAAHKANQERAYLVWQEAGQPVGRAILHCCRPRRRRNWDSIPRSTRRSWRPKTRAGATRQVGGCGPIHPHTEAAMRDERRGSPGASFPAATSRLIASDKVEETAVYSPKEATWRDPTHGRRIDGRRGTPYGGVQRRPPSNRRNRYGSVAVDVAAMARTRRVQRRSGDHNAVLGTGLPGRRHRGGPVRLRRHRGRVGRHRADTVLCLPCPSGHHVGRGTSCGGVRRQPCERSPVKACSGMCRASRSRQPPRLGILHHARHFGVPCMEDPACPATQLASPPPVIAGAVLAGMLAAGEFRRGPSEPQRDRLTP